MPTAQRSPNKLRVLVAYTDTPVHDVAHSAIKRLSRLDHVNCRTIQGSIIANISSGGVPFEPKIICADLATYTPFEWHEAVEQQCQWADLLVLLPSNANTLAKMLQGIVDDYLLAILRSWDVSKKILLVPGMSTLMWENPMTKKQLSKLRRKWKWIRVLQPLLWHFEAAAAKVHSSWEMQEVVGAVQNQVELKTIGNDIDPARMAHVVSFYRNSGKSTKRLPPEIWSMILEYTGDWELAMSLGVYTNLSIPPEWRWREMQFAPEGFQQKLEWSLLTGTLADVKSIFESHQAPSYLSRLSIKLMMRFTLTLVISYLESSHKDLFWTTFGHTFLPDKASSVFGKVDLLEYWRTSPSFLTKEYTTEAMDGASASGFIHILEWWQQSGLPLKYTESALEQASSNGHIGVLEWWKAASMPEGDLLRSDDSNESMVASSSGNGIKTPQLRLKPGKAICYASQSGSLRTLQWWAASGIPFTHEEGVAKIASSRGFVHILSYWKSVRGEKMIFDNQVLVGATKNGHAEVLEWWKKSGLRVEYKICDIEEALEDGVEGRRGEAVRRWWAANGLNLGVGTSEWMKSKFLN